MAFKSSYSLIENEILHPESPEPIERGKTIKQADQVKNSITESGKPFSELWVQRQKLEDLYKKLLIQDLEYALDKKVEQDLWNHAFKNQISILQTQSKDKENQKKLEAQASLNLFLETASGFYLQFLQMICSTFKLDLPFRRRSAAFGMTQENIMKNKSIVLPKKSSCLYICCHCLVHLGDIARYRQQMDQAQTFYRHAANLSPNNGQPYNQLAILEASRGDKLSTVFYYIRSLAVRHPFPVAATNLEKFYSKLIKDGRSNFDSTNLTVAEIIVAFLQFEALLHMSTDLGRASGLKTKITLSLATHIKSQSLTAAHLTGIVAIAIFAAHQARCDTTANGDTIKKSVMSEEEEKIVRIHISFIVKLLETLLQQTPKEDIKAKDFLTLSAIKVTFDWLFLNKDVIEGAEFSNTSLWQDFCKLINTLQWLLNEVNKAPDVTKYADTPLPEDADLRCFQPLEPSYSVFNFSKMLNEEMSAACERDLRCHRLIAHGRWIAHDLAKLKLIIFQPSKSIRTQFSTQKTATGSSDTPQHQQPKSQRQNVAMQTIMKKQLQKKMEQEKSPRPSGQLSQTVSEENKAHDSKYHPEGSNASQPGLLTGTEVNTGGSTGRQVGLIPVHHKGNNFKANLPPRLSAKAKASSSSVSPRMLKKDDPPRNRNNANSGNSTVNQVDFPGLSNNPDDYPSLNSDNYPALVSQRVATSLVSPNRQGATDISSSNTAWNPFGVKHERGQASVSSASSLLFSETVTPASDNGYASGVTPYSQQISPNAAISPNSADSCGSGRDSRPEAPDKFSPPSSQSEMERMRKPVHSNFSMADLKSPRAASSADPSILMQKHPNQPQPQPNPHVPSPPTQASQEMSSYHPHLPYNQQQLSQLLAHQQQQLLHPQRHLLRQPEPRVNQFSQPSSMMFDTVQANQSPVMQPPTSLVPTRSSLSTTQSGINMHSRDPSGHTAVQVMTSQNTAPRGVTRQTHPPMSGAQAAQNSAGMSGIKVTSNMSVGQVGGAVDSSRITNITNQLITNPALIGYIPASGMTSDDVGKKALLGSQGVNRSGLPHFGAAAAGRRAGPPQPYNVDSSQMNPYPGHQHFQPQQQQQQQQQQQHYHHQHQRSQQQHQHRKPSEPTPSTGLLYKNIPLAGGGGSKLQTGTNHAADTGMDVSPAMATPEYERRFVPARPNMTQTQNQAFAQLMASQPGFQSDSGRPTAFQGQAMGAPKPDLMGLRPSAPFLEQHNHSTKQGVPPPQPQSLMNTVIDPPFLQASGEYTLFNSANTSPSWQASLVSDGGTPRMRSGTGGSAKGVRTGVSVSGQMDQSSNMGGMWSNSGPSPLERLLQQQRNQRQGDS